MCKIKYSKELSQIFIVFNGIIYKHIKLWLFIEDTCFEMPHLSHPALKQNNIKQFSKQKERNKSLYCTVFSVHFDKIFTGQIFGITRATQQLILRRRNNNYEDK